MTERNLGPVRSLEEELSRMEATYPTYEERQYAIRASTNRHREHQYRPAPDSPGWEKCDGCPKMRLEAGQR